MSFFDATSPSWQNRPYVVAHFGTLSRCVRADCARAGLGAATRTGATKRGWGLAETGRGHMKELPGGGLARGDARGEYGCRGEYGHAPAIVERGERGEYIAVHL